MKHKEARGREGKTRFSFVKTFVKKTLAKSTDMISC